MAFYSFSGANGDPLPAGLTAQNGTFEIQSNRLAATGADPLGPKWVATTPSSADGTFSCIHNAASTSGTGGVVCRYTDNDNFWMAVINGLNADVKLFKREAGVFTAVGTTYTIPAYNSAADYKIAIVASGTSIKVQVDDVDRITDAGAQTFNQTQTTAGVRLPNTSQRIDDLTIPDGADTITITTQENRIWQRDGSGNATASIDGTYTGSPTSIQRSVDGGSWTTVDASPTGGTFSDSGVLSTGDYSISYRFGNNVGVFDTVNIAIGDVFACAGQSNMSGRGTNNQTFANSAGGITAYLFGNDDNYKLLADPYDSDAGQVDTVSSDASAAGSWVVRFANEWLANNEVPIGFIPCAKGGTAIADWARDLSAATLYGSMKRRIDAVGGVKAVLWEQGERDSADAVATAGATYQSALEQLAVDVNSDFGVETFVVPLHTITAAGYTNQAVIRQAQIDAATASANIRIGQTLTDIDLSSGDGIHFQTNAHLDLVATRMYSDYISPPIGPTYSLTLDAGSYTYTGSSVAIAASRALTLDSGGYAYTGNNVALAAGRKISIDSASYVYTGSAVNLKASRVLNISAGSYAYTGSNVNLVYSAAGGPTYQLTLDAGSYALTGSNVNIAASRKIALDSSAYSYAGAAVSLKASRALGIDTGSYSVTGSAVTLKASRSIALESASYVYTGLPVTLTYSGVVVSLISGYSVNYKKDDVAASYATDYITARFI